MRETLFSVCILLASLNAFAQTNEDQSFLDGTYNQKEICHNKIDSIVVKIKLPNTVVQRHYSFNNLGSITHIITFNQLQKKTSETTLFYENNLVKLRYDTENDLADTTEFIYNKEFQLVKNVKHNKDFGTAYTDYVYNTKGYLAKTITKGVEVQTIRYEYDTAGRLILIVENETDLFRKKEQRIFYDKRGLKIREELTSFGAGEKVYNYNSNSMLIKTINTYEKDLATYSYKNNLLSLKVIKNLDKPIEIRYRELYTYYRH